jgi:uroporphyrinogen-III synthase
MNNSLAGLTVVNTRPARQARPLSELILAAGGTIVEFPVIEIEAPGDTESFRSQLSNLAEANLAIFISANAVEASIHALGGSQKWPDNVAIAAVGSATAAKLDAMGLKCSLIAPEPFNSEALLTLSELQDMNGKLVKIFRGEGGREFLAQTLSDRGADVEYVECYRRVMPESVPAELYDCWNQKRVLLIVVTSNEGLENLLKLIESNYRPALLSTPLVVISQRTKNKAKELGFEVVPEVAESASKESILETIHCWYGAGKNDKKHNKK